MNLSDVRKRGSATRIEDLIPPATDDRPYRFDFKNSIALIQNAISSREAITIIGDYDADGVCASSILRLALGRLGVTPEIRLPLRFAEGYGMKPSMMEEIDSGLVITVDNGIAALDAAAAAKAKGMTLLITDHHLPASENGVPVLPEADCLIDPHVEELQGITDTYDYFGYCGAGIALKIAEKLLLRDTAPDADRFVNKLYALAAIATVADVMEITGDNRRIVRRGITAMADGEVTSGLARLMQECKIGTEGFPYGHAPWMFITSKDLSHKLGPCLNAPSRLVEGGGKGAYSFVREGGDGARISLACLLAEAGPSADKLASALNTYNNKRKELSDIAFTEVMRLLQERGMEQDSPIMLAYDGLRQGLTGNIAGKLEEKYGVPVILLTHSSNDDDIYHGSCRSPDGCNIRALLDGVADLLVTYGGHAGAAGISLKKEQIEPCRARLQELCGGFRLEPSETLAYDLEISVDEIPHVLDVMEREMAPFGPGNPEPVFLVRNFPVASATVLVKRHVKLSGGGVEAIGFGLTENNILPPEAGGKTAAMIGRLGYNYFRGRSTPQIQIDQLLSY